MTGGGERPSPNGVQDTENVEDGKAEVFHFSHIFRQRGYVRMKSMI